MVDYAKISFVLIIIAGVWVVFELALLALKAQQWVVPVIE